MPIGRSASAGRVGPRPPRARRAARCVNFWQAGIGPLSMPPWRTRISSHRYLEGPCRLGARADCLRSARCAARRARAARHSSDARTRRRTFHRRCRGAEGRAEIRSWPADAGLRPRVGVLRRQGLRAGAWDRHAAARSEPERPSTARARRQLVAPAQATGRGHTSSPARGGAQSIGHVDSQRARARIPPERRLRGGRTIAGGAVVERSGWERTRAARSRIHGSGEAGGIRDLAPAFAGAPARRRGTPEDGRAEGDHATEVACRAFTSL